MCSGVNSSNLLSIIFSMSSLSFSEGLRFSSIFLKEISSNSSFIFFFTGSLSGSRAFFPPSIPSIEPNDDSSIASTSLTKILS